MKVYRTLPHLFVVHQKIYLQTARNLKVREVLLFLGVSMTLIYHQNGKKAFNIKLCFIITSEKTVRNNTVRIRYVILFPKL